MYVGSNSEFVKVLCACRRADHHYLSEVGS